MSVDIFCYVQCLSPWPAAAVKLRKIARFRAEAYKIQILPALLGSTRAASKVEKEKKNRKAAKGKLKGF